MRTVTIGWLVAVWLQACVVASTDRCTFPYGSNSCDSGPILATQLVGSWCSAVTSRGVLCLHVQEDHRYRFHSPLCDERGKLTGGLEFWPSTGDCMLSGRVYESVYSASGDWTYSGVRLFFDGGRVVDLEYQDD
jgi:hypothetical protein